MSQNAQVSEASPRPKNIYQRMIDVQKAVSSVDKNEVVKMSENDRGYKAVTHDDVAAALHLPLANAGIVMLPDIVDFVTTEFNVEKPGWNGGPSRIQKWYRTDIKIKVEWINADEPTDRISSHGAAFALDTSDKSFAKAYSLALKIVLLKVHLLESRDNEEAREFERDEDPPAGTKKQAQQKQAQAPKNQPPAGTNSAAPITPKQSPPKSTPVAPSATADQLSNLRALMESRGVNDQDVRDAVTVAYGVQLTSPGAPFFISSTAATELIGVLTTEDSTGETLKAWAAIKAEERKTPPKPADNKPRATAPGPDPALFVMPFGNDDPAKGDVVAGKPLGEIGEAKLKEIFAWTTLELKKAQKPPVRNELFQINTNIKAFLRERGVEVN